MAKLKISQEILEIIYPIGSIYTSKNNVNPSSLFGGTWKLIRSTSGGELIAFGTVTASGEAEKEMQDRTYYCFSDHEVSYYKTPMIRNYVDGILTYDSGTLRCYTKGIAGFVKCQVYISGWCSSTNQAIWFAGNGNDIPSGVTYLHGISGGGILVGGAASSNGYGGQGMTHYYSVETDEDVNFFINPQFCPYNGNMIGCRGGVKSSLMVEVYAKPGYCLWQRIA